MKVKEIMSRSPVLKETVSAVEGIKVMWPARTGCAVVMKDKTPVGIFTETDVIRALAMGIDLEKTPVKKVMSQPVISVSSDTSVQWAAELMTKLHIRRLLVIDDDGYKGVVTASEIMKVIPNLIDVQEAEPGRIEHVLLIKTDGKLLAYESTTPGMDEDLIASMVTALESFVHHTLREKGTGVFHSLHYGRVNIGIAHGSTIVVACVVNGELSKEIKQRMIHLMRRIEDSFGTEIRSWDGDSSKIADLRNIIRDVMGV